MVRMLRDEVETHDNIHAKILQTMELNMRHGQTCQDILDMLVQQWGNHGRRR